MSYNPNQPNPTEPVGKLSKAAALNKVKTPAILLMISGIISLLTNVVGGSMTAVLYLGMKDEIMKELEKNPNQDVPVESLDVIFNLYGYGGIVCAVLGLIVGAFVIFAAVRMMKLQGWGMALTAAILSLIPCFQGCCLLAMPAGIYAMVVLLDSSVKPTFD
jgi:uncharacterized protein YneF (UPF0154 family)